MICTMIRIYQIQVSKQGDEMTDFQPMHQPWSATEGRFLGLLFLICSYNLLIYIIETYVFADDTIILSAPKTASNNKKPFLSTLADCSI